PFAARIDDHRAMEFERMMADLFVHEDQARDMARRLMELSKSNPTAAARERDGLLAFLRGPLERHMAHEERAIFPLLREHGLSPEVDVAVKHHETIRLETEK